MMNTCLCRQDRAVWRFIEMTASYFIGVTENGASAIGGGGGGVSCRSFATWTIKRYRGTTGRRAIAV